VNAVRWRMMFFNLTFSCLKKVVSPIAAGHLCKSNAKKIMNGREVSLFWVAYQVLPKATPSAIEWTINPKVDIMIWEESPWKWS